jgi:FtsP/CotA-like multicopper oxidase with cupredoxin domain
MPASPRGSSLGGGLALVVMAVLAACSTTAGPAAPATRPSHIVTTAIPATAPSSSVSTAIGAGPPVAALSAEGGDPTDGQLGTYVWGDGGSDSPWLPGARVAVGSGEPLTVSFRPDTTIADWSARSVPATADGPAGATLLGEGSGRPRFSAPEPGTWTIEVHVVFANARGNASYFWQLAVD